MYKKMVLISVFCVGSVTAMERGQTLQIVVNTPVAKVLRWLSSGRPEANIAAGAIAVCLAKSGFDIVRCSMRAWWWRSEEHGEKMHVEGCSSESQPGGDSDVLQSLTSRLASLEQVRSASSDKDETLVGLTRRLADLERNPSISAQEVGALHVRIQALETSLGGCSCASDVKSLRERIIALEGNGQASCQGHAGSDELGRRVTVVEGRMDGLENKFGVFEKQNNTDHATIRKDNLHQFTQALENLTARVTVTESQLKALQERAQLIMVSAK